ncbi:dockerin type I domain-containing protein [Agathobacter rectalis]|uniref:dockerin type I domain-containing protein n=1 Tax=Agathobacter rectalis TaxID=39491 RepID=UPI0027D33331|nr:dockerin type I domain-containing protein [Agathobacter rectalis]MCB7110552.1 dockerin type I domain-containing protein [Agathobacter rectalis]
MKILSKIILILYSLLLLLSFTIPFYIYKGDVNMDKNVDALDCITINRIIHNSFNYSLIQYINADIDCNGTIDKRDIDILSDIITKETKENLKHGETK